VGVNRWVGVNRRVGLGGGQLQGGGQLCRLVTVLLLLLLQW